MEETQDLDSNLIKPEGEEHVYEEVTTCCCCKKMKPRTQHNHVRRAGFWARIRATFSRGSNDHDDRVFHDLLKLYAHEDVVDDMQNVRINPSFKRDEIYRDDLEFFVPQLCNFLLFQRSEITEKLVQFLLSACQSSFYFSHRVWWFLNSTEPIGTTVDVGQLKSMVEQVSRQDDSLFIGNWIKLEAAMKNFGMNKTDQEPTMAFEKFFAEEKAARKQKIGEVISNYQQDSGSFSQASERLQIDGKDLILSPYVKPDNETCTFLSTIWFFEQLTEISISLIKEPNKNDVLHNALEYLNERLPAAVYIPFVKTQTRSCAILHIPPSEAKVFVTKERAPFMIVFEIYRPLDELKMIEKDMLRAEKVVGRSASVPEAYKKVRAKSSKASVYVDIDDSREVTVRQSIASRSVIPTDIRERISHLRPASDSDIVVPTYVTEELPPEIEHPDEETNEEEKDHYSSNYLLNKVGTGNTPRESVAFAYSEYSEFQEPKIGQQKPFVRRTLGSRDMIDETEINFLDEEQGIYKNSAKVQAEKIRQKSPFGGLRTWSLMRVIIKSGDDLRQEQLAMQLIMQFQQIFKAAKLPLWLRPYEILATGPGCGILECVPDAMSIDSVKKTSRMPTLVEFFNHTYGRTKSRIFKRARKAFVESLAGYSLFCYLLQVKDRHNGNILLDSHGHLIHIDFGFLISNSPGGGFNFEQAPFKLTADDIQVMGGNRSSSFIEFRQLCVKGFMALRKHADKIFLIVEMMRVGTGDSLPCFVGGEAAMDALKDRFKIKENLSEADCREYINRLIDESLDNWRTRWYDRYQYCCQNIL